LIIDCHQSIAMPGHAGLDLIFIDFPAAPRDRNLTGAALSIRFHHVDLKMPMPENCAGMVRWGPRLRS
jgi:hypothetical protein